MWASGIRLRISIEEQKRKEEGLKPGTEAYKKAIHEKHALVFFFVGMSLNLNLDTSLLTEKVFAVRNFANLTLFLFFSTLIVVIILYMFLVPYKFHQLVVAMWLLSISRGLQLVAAAWARGKFGRNVYLLLYTFDGFLRGVISLTSNHVISKKFLNACYLHIVNGVVFFSILVSLLQIVCDTLIGTETLWQMRLSLILAQTLNFGEPVIAAIWVSVVYMTYEKKIFQDEITAEGTGADSASSSDSSGSSGSNGQQKKDDDDSYEWGKQANESWQKFKYVPYYASKFTVAFISLFFRVLFHPVIIPFTMDIPYISKLLSSIIFTMSEFFGRLTALNTQEYIDDSKKGKSTSDWLFLVREDFFMYLLFVYQLVVCSLCIYSSWTQKFGISTNYYVITFVTLTSGYIVGYTDNRGKGGAQAVVQYFARINAKGQQQAEKKTDENSKDGTITQKVAEDNSNVNDILTLSGNLSLLFGIMFSYWLERLITQHKRTYSFIISANKHYLDEEATNTLLSLF